MDILIREFRFEDIPNKVKWINDSYNNKYLHYNLPLDVKETEEWYLKNVDNENRYDATIMVNQIPVGIIGLINIDYVKNQGEYYITIGERTAHGKGVAHKASDLLLEYAFDELKLKKIYLTTEQDNIGMQKLANRIGMLQESLLLDHSFRDNKLYNAYYYSIVKKDYYNKIKFPTQILSDIEHLEKDRSNNSIYMKRDDLLSFSFGGNKARKARYFFDEIISGDYKTIVTYGSKFSNHARVVANMCKKNNLKCIIVSPYGNNEENYNEKLIKMNNAEMLECDVNNVPATLKKIIKKENKRNGDSTYFIPGGGHGNLGTQAYVDAYHEVEIWSRRNQIDFDYIFLASGTGTTQAGFIIGNQLHKKMTEIVGISVARKKDYGSKVIEKSIKEYLETIKNYMDRKDIRVNFYDDLVETDYGKTDDYIDNTIMKVYHTHGIALSRSYTGKAYAGMKKYINKKNLQDKKILFLNTGGVPLFFDDISKINKEKGF